MKFSNKNKGCYLKFSCTSLYIIFAQDTSNLEADLQKYLSDHNVEAILKDIVVKLCVDKPDNVLDYIKNYITNLQNQEAGRGGGFFLVYCRFFSVFLSLILFPMAVPAKLGTTDEHDAMDDDDEDAAEDSKIHPRGRSRRAAISASVMTADDVEDYERKVSCSYLLLLLSFEY